MGGARHGKGNGVCKASLGVYEGCSVPYIKFWFHALRFWRESKGRRFLQTLVFASLFCFTSVAYADSGYQSGLAGVIQGPSAWYEYGASVDDPYYGYFCYAYDKYEAAVWSLGLDPTDASFTSEVKAKLSNASTGGRFYTYADEFHTFGANSEPHAWLSRDFYGQWVTLYGRDYLYWGEVTTAEQDGAKADLQTILNGGNLGGGSAGDSDEYVYFKGNILFYSSGANNIWLKGTDGSTYYTNTWNNDNGTTVQRLPTDITVRVLREDLAGVGNGIDSANLILSMYAPQSTNSIMVSVGVSSDLQYGTNTQEHGGQQYISRFVMNSPYVNIYFDRNTSLYDVANGVLTIVSTSKKTMNKSPFTLSNDINILAGSADEPIPPTNWPDSDPVETPQPPELPEPGDPVIDPQPDPPTPPINPTFPIFVGGTTTTYTADLQGILDAMNDHCIHLQSAIHTGFSDFWTVLSTKMTNDFATLRQFLHGQFGWLGETIQEYLTELVDYLFELFQWLADQFEYAINGGAYNDETVVSWLKKIYGKLGTGNSSRPVDPVADPYQTGSWLDTLINNLLTALGDLFPGLLDQVSEFFGGALGNLMQKFPFSIPWDVAAILGLLVADPVAPSVEIPAYTLTVEGLAQAGSYDIDLSAYDAAWGAVRLMMRIAFALYVCVHTKDFLEVIERVMM